MLKEFLCFAMDCSNSTIKKLLVPCLGNHGSWRQTRCDKDSMFHMKA